MELYLDSANLKEIEEGFKLGFLDGLTTTPTFMQREGITDVDSTIVKLSKMVPILQIEALGEKAEEVVQEAERLLGLGLDPEKTVFKIPVALEGVRACHLLRKKGLLVNVHLVYTLQQAYMAMHAGATYVCPLVGRLQDQGHDALLNVVEEGCRWFDAGKPRTAGRPEGCDAGFLEDAHDLDIVDMSVSVHVTPAHGHQDLDAPGFHGLLRLLRTQLCTAVESSTAVSSPPANWDMYKR